MIKKTNNVFQKHLDRLIFYTFVPFKTPNLMLFFWDLACDIQTKKIVKWLKENIWFVFK